MKRAARGQAVVETAIFMPIFLLMLLGAYLIAAQSAMSERVQLAVRYGGIISTVQNPYIGQSLYALYGTIDGQDPAPTAIHVSNCSGTGGSVNAQTSVLTDPTRHTFWQPLAGSITPTCNADAWYQQTGGNGTGVFGYSYTLNEHALQLSAQVPVSSFLANGALAGQVAEGGYAFLNAWTTSTIGQDLNCGYLGTTVKSSLEAGTSFPPLGYYAGSGYGGSWGGSLAAPLPSAAPFLGSTNFFYCNQTLGAQAIHSPAPS